MASQRLRFSDFVPEYKTYWHYHAPSGVLLRNHPEFGWVAKNGLDKACEELRELEKAVQQAKMYGSEVTTWGDVEHDDLTEYMKEQEDALPDN